METGRPFWFVWFCLCRADQLLCDGATGRRAAGEHTPERRQGALQLGCIMGAQGTTGRPKPQQQQPHPKL